MRFVQADKLEPGMVLGRSIIGMKKTGMMLSRGMTLNESYIAHIQQHGYLGVYITDNVSKEVEVQEVIDDKLISEGIEAVFQSDIGALTDVATKMIQQISQKNAVKVDLFDLRSYDDYTYHHSVNVAVYASVIGRKMGLSYEDLELLSMAALSHDLGKSKIPEMILNKPGRLDEEEYNAIKQHSKYSYDILTADHHNIPAKVRLAVLFHHENEDGSGYPYGKTGDEIPLFAKIIHAADVFDALTSKRPYKQPYSPVEAYKYMLSEVGTMFDENVINSMMTCIPAYPPGLGVILSNGQKALVVGSTIHAMRPIIKLLDTGETINLYTDENYKDIEIVVSDIMHADYAQKVELLNENRQKKKARRLKILVVDNSINIRGQIKNALSEEFDVKTMTSGLEVINYFGDERKADLLIISTDLTTLSGMSTVHTLREAENDVPVIFMANKVNRDMLMECKYLGAVDCILKPFNIHYVIERVELAMSSVER